MFHSLSSWSGHSGASNASASIFALAAASLTGFASVYSFCKVDFTLSSDCKQIKQHQTLMRSTTTKAPVK